MAWLSRMETVHCTDLFLKTILLLQFVAFSVMFSFYVAERRTLEDVLQRHLLYLLLKVFEIHDQDTKNWKLPIFEKGYLVVKLPPIRRVPCAVSHLLTDPCMDTTKEHASEALQSISSDKPIIYPPCSLDISLRAMQSKICTPGRNVRREGSFLLFY